MAKSKGNVVMEGASGTVGKMLVFRQRGDQTIIARRPTFHNKKAPTVKQLDVQNRFMDASLYARTAIQDPDLKAAYQAKANINQTAFNVAFKDYFTAPVIRRWDDSGYQGNAMDQILFMVKDVMKVVKVQVGIFDANDLELEVGMAQDMDGQGISWMYQVQADNSNFENAKYRVTLTDTPGHEYTYELVYGNP
ncbi:MULTISPECIES: hypothetical protein [Sphingobacterium]|jgi:hypothetical protein|uniref:hypothetical protein n=1 Tax=Sphingobacterium TaxID=28453 RepID=UPI000DFA002B|nr:MULTISPECIES: hypothetical protein [Sphingobacterium]QQT43648.1 hypothetical protein I6J00_18095 [Sphingobacterium multivorum]QQT63547.1 hypothetical protein I6I97_07110 [Sphingobacterium multivorum]SUI97757.1 Uncharacterised protein [Sphingobacterium multivorum]